MTSWFKLAAISSASAFLFACATVTPPTPVTASIPQTAPQPLAQIAPTVTPKMLKRKIAIGRFTNETSYGKTFLRDGDQDPLGKQASDMLATRLVQAGQFMVFERPDLSKLQKEQELSGIKSSLLGVDALILGSITEFGRQTEGKQGFLSEVKNQVARAKVELRLVDPRTGYTFFSATGTGEANTETGSVAGFGSRAAYDQTLNDRAIGAALSDVQNELINKLQSRRWSTDILDVDGQQIVISGGSRQGLKIGDELIVLKRGKQVTSSQSGFSMELPPQQVASITVRSFFGDAEHNEISTTILTSGTITALDKKELIVMEKE